MTEVSLTDKRNHRQRVKEMVKKRWIFKMSNQKYNFVGLVKI